MKLTFPHMGNLYIAMRALFENLGAEVVIPPKSSKRTLTLGTRYSPEFACLPLKVNIGNFIEAFEMGADTIVMAGGVGPCRFGYYGEVQREILKDLGYEFEMVVIEPPQGRIGHLLERVKKLVGKVTARQVIYALKLTWAKMSAVDELERLANVVRAREAEKGSTSKVLETVLGWVDSASTIEEVRDAKEEGLGTLKRLPMDGSREPLKVALVGEIYVVLEPFVNLHVERELGEMGVEVERSIYIGEWVKEHVVGDLLRFGRKNPVKDSAKPYLCHFVGGHGLESVGRAVEYAKRGFHGVVQVMPFTCMPEIVAQSILPSVSRDYDIPIMTLIFDEHSAEAGVITRLEAFVDLMSRRRK